MFGEAVLWLALIVVILLAAVGCGSTPPAPWAPPRQGAVVKAQASCDPAPGAGVMGSCVPPTFGSNRLTLTLRGPFVPDVSEFQGRPCWSCARPHISGAIVRVADLITGQPDTSFAYNWHALRTLHIWHATYAFVRPGNCSAEADRAVGYVNAQGGFDSGPLIADAEVPLPYFCVTIFLAEVERDTGWHVAVVYTAQGTWPGGAHDGALLWDAAYGPEPGCVWTCHRVAWQDTDGVFGPYPHSIPGIGSGDISRDEGITRLIHQHPAPPLTRRQLKRLRVALRTDLTRHRCRVSPHHGRGRYHRLCARWLRAGKQVNHELHSKGIR